MTKILLTDSMKTIQKKLNLDMDIVFQTGTYKITKQLVLPANANINLNHSTLQRCANIQSIFINQCTTKTTKYNGAGNIRIFNGTLEAMGKYEPDNLLTFFHSHNIILDNITFLDNLCHDVELNSCNDVKIQNCKFLGYNASDIYKEMIQIDAAYPVGFWKTGSTINSKCYDATMCRCIVIINCEFNKSSYRGYPEACIGTHVQLVNGLQHNGLLISQNKFVCNNNQYCLSLIGMNEVIVLNNTFENCSKVARIYTKDYSYNLKGQKVNPGIYDGLCINIEFDKNKGTGYIYKFTEPKKKIKISKGDIIL